MIFNEKIVFFVPLFRQKVSAPQLPLSLSQRRKACILGPLFNVRTSFLNLNPGSIPGGYIHIILLISSADIPFLPGFSPELTKRLPAQSEPPFKIASV
jgi:hypothetical protein